MRALLAVLVLAIVHPLHAQPIPEGDEVRVREGKGAPWATGIYAGNDSVSIVLMQAGIDRTYELLGTERIEWKAPRNLALETLLYTAGGIATGLIIEWFSLVTESACWDWSNDTGCSEDWGKAAGIGAAVGASMVIVSYAISPRRWKNMTKHYPPAGGNQ
jgi:hypothetical protein